jgi:hypothetical protein
MAYPAIASMQKSDRRSCTHNPRQNTARDDIADSNKIPENSPTTHTNAVLTYIMQTWLDALGYSGEIDVMYCWCNSLGHSALEQHAPLISQCDLR